MIEQDQDIDSGDERILIEFREINKKARRKAMEKILFESHYADYKARIEGGAKPEGLMEECFFKKVRTHVGNSRHVSATGYWWFTFTVNRALFTDDSYLARLQKKVDKALTKKCVKRAIWTYELTKEAIPHVHMLVELDPASPIASNKLTEGFQNTFKDVGYVHARFCPENHVQDKLDYIHGTKWDTEKEQMIEEDRLWREQVGIKPVYTYGDWAELWGGRGLLS